MECRHLTEKDLPQAKTLWKQAFGDSNDYISFNFKRNINLAYSFGFFDDKRLACMLYMQPKTIVWGSRQEDVFFITGVATDKAYQRTGLASKIMKHAREFLFIKKIPVVFLYPFNHQFYKKMGYHTVSWMKKVEFSKSSKIKEVNFEIKRFDKSKAPDVKQLLSLYDTFGKTKCSYFKRSVKDMVDMVDTMLVDDGKFIILKQDGKLVGYILYFILQGKFYCIEAVFVAKAIAKEAIKLVSNEYAGFLYVDDSFDIEGAKTQEYAMMQVVTLSVALKVYNAKTVDEILNTEIMILEQY